MNHHCSSFFRRAYKDQRGQMIPIIAFMMITFLGMAGLVVDAGHAYFAYRLLLNSTNAAAMAGAQGLGTSGSLALSNAQAYSSQSGKNNAYPNLNVTHSYFTLGCSSSFSQTVPCVPTGSGSSTANAIQVIQTASVPTTFMRLFGYNSINISAKGTALMRGAGPKAYNLAVIVDATQSMNSNDSYCSKTRIACALSGVQTLLQTISPCSVSGCGSVDSSGNYTNAIDRVSIFTFPEPSSATQAAYDYDCSSSTSPSIVPYTYPTASPTKTTGYSPASGTPTYQVTGFMSNYQTVNSSGAPTGSVNTSSSSYVGRAVGSGSCSGMQAPGGEGTYYAGVIYAAEAALLAEQAAEASNNQTVQNAMIIVSDGAATSSQSQMSSSGLKSTGTYPSYKSECGQAVTAAQDANSKGITVYSVAYGSQTSGCTTDSGTYASPCATMKGMASNVNTTFYSDAGSNSGGCSSTLDPSTLGAIFTSIGGQLTAARLIPNTSFPSS